MTLSRAELETAVGCMDLTSLGGDETKEEIVGLCERARDPGKGLPHVAAVVVYPSALPVAVSELDGTDVLVASVAGDFPSGTAPVPRRLEEIRRVAEAGADEIDAVLDRRSLLAGRDEDVVGEVASMREACGTARLKVILETGALPSADDVRRGALLAMRGGADMVKTSTGKTEPGATVEAAMAIMDAASEFREREGERRGVKVSGGIRTADQVAPYLDAVDEVLGPGWLTPDLFRIGASMLLDDLVARKKGS